MGLMTNLYDLEAANERFGTALDLKALEEKFLAGTRSRVASVRN